MTGTGDGGVCSDMPFTANPDNTLTEPDLALYAKTNVIKEIRIQEVIDGFIVQIPLTWRPEELYLSTRRERDQPKRFKAIEPLLELLPANVPDLRSVTLDLRPAGTATPPPP